VTGSNVSVRRPKVPAFTSLHGYQRQWLRGDAIAGLTVWAVLVPEALTTGVLALAAGLARLGFVANFISEPVLKGFAGPASRTLTRWEEHRCSQPMSRPAPGTRPARTWCWRQPGSS
jgi:hypothetical protein